LTVARTRSGVRVRATLWSAFHGGAARESPMALPGRAGRAIGVTRSRPVSGQDECG